MTVRDLLMSFDGIDAELILAAAPSERFLKKASSRDKAKILTRLAAFAAAIVLLLCSIPLVLSMLRSDPQVTDNYTEILGQCDLAVFGTYKGKNEKLTYSEYVFEITEVLKGELKEREISVRSKKHSPFSSDEMEIFAKETSSEFKNGEEYFLTLQRSVVSGGRFLSESNDKIIITFLAEQIIAIDDLGNANSASAGLAEFFERHGITADTSRQDMIDFLEYMFKILRGETSPLDDFTFEFESALNSYAVTGYTGKDKYIVVPGEYEGQTVRDIYSNAFKNNVSIKGVYVSEGVTWLSDSAFEGCVNLLSASLPNTLRYTGMNVFADCRKLVSVDINGDLQSVFARCFKGCRSLKYINLPDSLVEIGSSCFEGCTSLTEINIPKSTKILKNTSFIGCTGITKITVDEGNEYFHSEGNCIIETQSKTLIMGCANSVIPADDSVTRIAHRAFYGCEITEITIPGNIVTIEQAAFGNCYELRSVKIAEGVKHIADMVFLDCLNLESIEIPSSIETIDNFAFDGLTAVDSYNVYENMCYLGNDENPYVVLVKPLNKAACVDVTLPDGVKIINYGAFFEAPNLKSVTLPASVTGISEDAFSGCPKLERVTIPEGIKWIGREVFNNCKSLNYNKYGGALYLGDRDNPYRVLVKAADTGIKEAIIAPGTKIILNYAFNSCTRLTRVSIPDSLKCSNGNAFHDCPSITRVEITDLDSWRKIDFKNNFASPINMTNSAKLYLNGEEVTAQ